MYHMPDPPAHNKPADHATRANPRQCSGVFRHVAGGFIQVGWVSERGAAVEIHTGVSNGTRGPFALGPVFTSYSDFWASVA